MTGFGRYECSNEQHKIIVEIKSVNHRYLDIGVKMSKKLGHFEAGIKTLMKSYVQRGKVDLYITYEALLGDTGSILYNQDAAAKYVSYFRQIAEEFQIPNDAGVSVLAGCPEVFRIADEPEEDEPIWELIVQAVRGAAERFIETRINEGERLRHDMSGKLEGMLVQVGHIEEVAPQLLEVYRTKLENRIHSLLGSVPVDEGRIATELVLYADKSCIDEELVRLRSHIHHMSSVFDENGGAGRELDFIAQEMNREANTILSKANDMDITGWAIGLKTEIEKIREQIQNIE
jgi:uncharacterized protein (TIGR00255 family)